MLLDSINLSIDTLDRLCPFHIVFCDSGERPQITSMGSALKKLIGTPVTFSGLREKFEVIRPRESIKSLPDLAQSCKMIVLQCSDPAFCLRGLLIRFSSNSYLYYCSVEISSSHTLTALGLKMSDFSPADPTPDILILHRFRELMMQDQQKQIEELRKIGMARDTFDRHANTDMLTGIGNRRLFFKQGSDMLAESCPDQVTAIILMDLDRFKQINDSHGHDVGDAVLRTVAARCQDSVSDFGIVARLGGDEFVALVRLSSLKGLHALVDELLLEISRPMVCVGRHLEVHPSMGVSVLEPGQSVDEAIHFADLAMYEGRKGGDGQLSWFTPDMQTQENYRKTLAAQIGQAIDSGEIIPYFQPLIDLETRQTYGYEVLARWQHPEHGLIFPDVFIGIAAESGCLAELDYCMLESGLNQLSEWDREGKPTTVHVNLCAISVKPNLDARVMKLLAERNIDPARLTLELTETTLLEFETEEKAVLSRLTSNGVNIQLDDFGTGFSSLTHLHDFPVNGLKIDRSFLFDFPDDARSRALIESVMAIARRLNLVVVTEGIETNEQMVWIDSIGGHYGQGYLFGKPVPASECRHDAESTICSLRRIA